MKTDEEIEKYCLEITTRVVDKELKFHIMNGIRLGAEWARPKLKPLEWKLTKTSAGHYANAITTFIDYEIVEEDGFWSWRISGYSYHPPCKSYEECQAKASDDYQNRVTNLFES